jgi:hypothetical protein
MVFDSVDEPSGAEIKSGKTFQVEFMKNLEYWIKTTKARPENQIIIYGGNQQRTGRGIKVMNWKEYLRKRTL